MNPTTWRLLLTDLQEPALNMAIDEALLMACEREGSAPVLRLYTWNPPALTLGRFQKVREEIDLEACRRRGISIVRRPTGGKAILHDRDLTYSVIGPTSMVPWGGDILETYRTLSGALVTGLRLLGITAELLPLRKRAPRRSPFRGACALFPASYEVAVGGKKLVGSAQKRLRRSFLQHGSIPLFSDVEANREIFRSPQENGAQGQDLWREKATTISEQVPIPPSYAQIAEAIVRGFREFLGVDLPPAELSSEELSQAQELVRLKYARPEWNLQGLESIQRSALSHQLNTGRIERKS
ncbi:MAG: lipoate--protein ligase family protein [Candidatus Tectomicrobia bacterium]|uniref:Lipoate--protein ligase family protein n=1 Tax=Tectimicrobiota bacterium TaxID=2528274 RepID=A0A932M1C4_UNCTE|nr:lipoate--protein ligase family protein [Candidatus Tectomicrobia bacterium]